MEPTCGKLVFDLDGRKNKNSTFNFSKANDGELKDGVEKFTYL